MKKLLIALLSAAFLFGSCAKIEDVTVDTKGNSEIAFNANSGVNTKAIVTGTQMLDNFGVYGYVAPGSTYSAAGGYLMKNAEYEETGVAANGAHYYWPKSDNNETVDFLFTAYAQFDNNVSYEDATGNITIPIPALTQGLIDDPSDFDDVLWAQTNVNHQNANEAHSKVNLTFKHALSWLEFRAEVVENSSIEYAIIDSIKFTTDGPSVPGAAAIPAVYDTTDTWVNLKRSYSAVGSATRLKGPGETSYTNAAPLPDELVAEIKSYYSIDNGTAGDYDLHMGNSVWPSATIKQLRVVKAIPEAYKVTVEMTGGEKMSFFNGWKYLQDNGYDIQPSTSGGKPAVWDYILIDAFVNGAAYTVVGLNPWDSNAAPQHTIEEVSPAVPAQDPIPGAPGASDDGIYTAGTLVLPTRSMVDSVLPTYSGDKTTTFNFTPNYVKLFGTSYEGIHEKVLSDVLVIPQAVPKYLTIVYDICIKNATGDSVLITGRRITRQINSGNDADGAHTYVATWDSANKYIYNFRINVEETDFNVNVSNWDTNTMNYHVWDY